MKKFVLIIAPILAIALFAGYRYLTREQPIKVTVQTVDNGVVEATVANTRAGTVTARNRANLTPAIGGQIATLNVRKADTVKAGQVLLTLWNKDLQAEMQLAKSEAVAAEAAVREACLMADLAQRQAGRQSDLRRIAPPRNPTMTRPLPPPRPNGRPARRLWPGARSAPPG